MANDTLKLPWDRESAIAGAADACRASASFADVTFVCHEGGGDPGTSSASSSFSSLPAHQAVLARVSPLLATLFRARSGCCAASADPATVFLPGARRGAVAALLQFVYTGQVALVGQAEAREFAGLAKALKVALPREAERVLRRAGRKRRAEEALAAAAAAAAAAEGEGGRSKKPALAVRPNEDGVFECWRCGQNYASERSLFSHSVLCARAASYKDAKDDDSSSASEDEEEEPKIVHVERDQVGSFPIPDTMRLVARVDVALEEIQVKEEPLDADGHVVNLDTCRFCMSPFTSRGALLRHLCLSHFRPHLTKAYGHLPACPFCGAAFSFSDSSGLIVHVGVEHDRVLKYLDFCSENPEDLNCGHCGSAEEDPEALIRHLATRHYFERLKRAYPAADSCPQCRAAQAEESFYEHLVAKHFAVFSVAPRRVREQLLRVMTDEMLEVRENFGTNASSVPEQSVEMEDMPNPNFICPVCETPFALEEELKEDLASHYVGELERLFGRDLRSCPFCDSADGGGGGDGAGAGRTVTSHIALAHGQLSRVLPENVRSVLAAAGLSWCRRRERGPAVTVSTGKTPDELSRIAPSPVPTTSACSATHPTPPPGSKRPADDSPPAPLPTPPAADSGVKRCPACNVSISSMGFDRHVSVVHLQSEIQPYVNPEQHQCKICHAVLSSNRIAMTHVAKRHGFTERWMEEQRKLVEKRRNLLQHQDGAEKNPTAGECDPATSRAGHTSKISRLSDAASSFGSVSCPLPGCPSRPFHVWSKWKKHIYMHVKEGIVAEYPHVDKRCPVCQKVFNQRFETHFHIGMAHNRVFANLPPDILERLRSDGLTVNPNKREYACPMCTDGTIVVGAYTFKCHLFSHVRPRMRASFLRRGNSCADCGESFIDFNTTVKHVALEHNKFVDFLPGEIVTSIKAMGFFSASKATPATAAAAPPRETIRVSSPQSKVAGTVNVASPFSNVKGSVEASASASASASTSASPFNLAKEKQSWISVRRPRRLVCPVCQRSDFPNTVYLKRHLLGVHYIDQFRSLYGHCNRMCPICRCVKCSHTDNLRHIAIVHDRLRTVMPADVVERLVAGRILEPKVEERRVAGADGGSSNTATVEVDGQKKEEGGKAKEDAGSVNGSPVIPTVMTPKPLTRVASALSMSREEGGRGVGKLKIKPLSQLLMDPSKEAELASEPEEKAKNRPPHQVATNAIQPEQKDKDISDKTTKDRMNGMKPDEEEEVQEKGGSKDAEDTEKPPGKLIFSVKEALKCKTVLSSKLVKRRGRKRRRRYLVSIAAVEETVNGASGNEPKPQEEKAEEEEGCAAVTPSAEKTLVLRDELEEEKEEEEKEEKKEEEMPTEVRQEAAAVVAETEAKGKVAGDGDEAMRSTMSSPTSSVSTLSAKPSRGRKRKATARRCPSCEETFRDPFELCAHVVTSHHRKDLSVSLPGLQGVCPDCGSRQRNDDRFLVHLFVVHGRMREADGMSEEERDCFRALDGDRRLKVKKEGGGGRGSDEKGKKTEEIGATVASANRATLSKIKRCLPSSPGWRNAVYLSCRDQLRKQFPDVKSACPFCPRAFPASSEGEDACLRHVGLRHYRCFDFVDRATQEAVLAANPACFQSPADRDGDAGGGEGGEIRAGSSSLPCPTCPFATTSRAELREHLVAHHYQDLKDRMRAKPAGTFICTLATHFDCIAHLGWEHGKLAELAATADARRLLQATYSVDVRGCRAAANDLLMDRPRREFRRASLSQLLRHHGLADTKLPEGKDKDELIMY